MVYKDAKIEIPCVNKCLRCEDMCKINDSQINNTDNLLVMEWICDCGYMYKTTKEISYI